MGASNTSRHQQPRQLPGREEQPSSTSPTTTMASRAPLPSMNPWEAQALTHSFPDGGVADRSGLTPKASFNRRPDPLIFPGLYCSSGFDIISILLQLRSRPDPDIDLGAVDCSVSLTLCDLEQPDTPIVYASPSFCELTGYSMNEVLGRNCRFLQSSPTCSPSFLSHWEPMDVATPSASSARCKDILTISSILGTGCLPRRNLFTVFVFV